MSIKVAARTRELFLAGAADIRPAVLEEADRIVVATVLAMVHGNRRAAAAKLGLSRAQLYNKIRDFGLGDEPVA